MYIVRFNSDDSTKREIDNFIIGNNASEEATSLRLIAHCGMENVEKYYTAERQEVSLIEIYFENEKIYSTSILTKQNSLFITYQPLTKNYEIQEVFSAE